MLFDGHASDESLIAYLDGELRLYRQKSVHWHLQACWSCRVRLAELAKQILLVTKAVERDVYPGPVAVEEAHARFLSWSGNLPFDALQRPPHRSMFTALCWGLAALILMAGVSAWWFSRRQPAPSVQQIMALAQQAGLPKTRSSVQAEFKLVATQIRPSVRQEETRLKVWSDPEGERHASRWEDGKGVLRRAIWQPAPDRVFVYDYKSGAKAIMVRRAPGGRSAIEVLFRGDQTLEDFESAFMAWLEQQRWEVVSMASGFAALASQEGVDLTMREAVAESGYPVLRLSLRKKRGSVLVEAALEVEPRTYRARLQRVRYETLSAAYELRLIPERALPVVTSAVFEPDPSLLDLGAAPAMRTTMRRPTSPSAAQLPPVTFQPARPDPIELETEVLYGLHRAGACLGEPVEIAHRPGGALVVRGVVPTVARKEYLTAVMAGLEAGPWLNIEIRTTGEAMAEAGPLSADLSARYAPSAAARERTARKGLGEPRLRPELVDLAISRADKVMAEAWALHHLANTYGSLDPSSLSGRARLMAEAMSLDHLRALLTQTADLTTLLETVLGPGVAPDDRPRAEPPSPRPDQGWSPVLLRLFHSGRIACDNMNALFGEDGPPGGTRAARVLADFRELQAGILQWNETLTAAFVRSNARAGDRQPGARPPASFHATTPAPGR